ncbi:hypothetical protein [Wolbachia endosymbiont of Oedothorax gibbosus]|uniref:hypothetical protein n=1 Tax=Wolbachia endosymbiont of Oedothorax gibbosus TaxID=931100 RepID=UPI002023F716|nr:hypothetical protein [Wolbachia endosymbiont of Oedothorax gibbosus]
MLYLPCAVLALGLHLSISTLLTVAKITLFPEFFLSLWIKEGIKFSRIFSLSITQFHNVDFYSYIEDSETFFKMKDSNRKLLVALLKDSDFSIQDDTPFHFYETHLEFVTDVTTKISDKEKSKIIFDYLGLSSSKPLIQKDRYSNCCLHEIYDTHERLIKVVNDIDIGLLKTLLKLNESSVRDQEYMRILRLSNVIDLFDDHDLAKNMSDAFRNKQMLAVQMAEYLRIFLGYEYNGCYSKKVMQDNLKKLFLKKDLIPSNLGAQSGLMLIIKHFLRKEMSEREFDNLTSMLEDKDVIDNLKHIDDINNVLPHTLECNGYSTFLGLREIFDLKTTASDISNLHLLLTNNRLFYRFRGIPIRVLRKICSTKLYENCANVDEVLAFFDCLDDKSKNKNILDNLIVAFEKDPEATHALLNSKMFNSRDKVLQMLSDKRFDGNKVREILNRINLWWTLQENDMVYKASYLNTTEKFSYVFNPQHIKFAFYTHTHDDVPHNESDQQKRAFLENVGLFQLLLETTIKARYESVFSIIKDTKFEHLADGRFISKVRDKINRYLSNLLIFKGNLFSDISNTFRLQIIDIVFSFNSQTKLHTTLKERWEKILKIKFTELFVTQKYEQITQESLAKIQDLTIKDLSAIPETEEIEEFLKNKGITNSDDLSLLAKLIEDGIHIVNVIGERVSLTQDITQTICDTFKDISVNHNTKQTPPSLLNLCKTNIIKSSLTEQISC